MKVVICILSLVEKVRAILNLQYVECYVLVKAFFSFVESCDDNTVIYKSPGAGKCSK